MSHTLSHMQAYKSGSRRGPCPRRRIMYSKARSATASGRGVPIRMESHRRGARFASSRSIRFISRSICWRSQAVEGEISRENMTGRGGHTVIPSPAGERSWVSRCHCRTWEAISCSSPSRKARTRIRSSVSERIRRKKWLECSPEDSARGWLSSTFPKRQVVWGGLFVPADQAASGQLGSPPDKNGQRRADHFHMAAFHAGLCACRRP